MRISDWSSDVCSSDLFRERGTVRQPPRPWAGPTFERLQMQLLNTMLDTLRKRTTAAARRVARQQKRSRIGHNGRSEEHTSELQSLMRISYAVFCLKKKIIQQHFISEPYKILTNT